MPVGKARSSAPPYEPPTFPEFCAHWKVTSEEWEQLAWHLAIFRARKTYLALRIFMGGVLR